MLKGSIVALVTPFKNNDIDYNAVDRLISFHLENKTDGILINGTTGESPSLASDEKEYYFRYVIQKVNGRVPIMIGTGTNNLARTIIDTTKAKQLGADSALVITPYYNKPTQEGLYQHYCALSQVSPLPIILYNVPGRTGVNMRAETTLRLARECANIVAVKEASGDLSQIKAIIDKAPEGFYLISGDDAITTDVIALGGIGVISVFANAFPGEMVWLVRNALEGNIAGARRKMNADFEELFHLMFVEGNPAGVKCLLSLRGMIHNRLRLPLVPVSAKIGQLIKEELAKFVAV